MACIQRVYIKFIYVIAASGPLFRTCNQMLCVNTVKGIKCGNSKDILNFVAHFCNEYLQELKYKCGNIHYKNKGY